MFCPECGFKLEIKESPINFCCECGCDISDRYPIINNIKTAKSMYGIVYFFKDIKKSISLIEGTVVNYREISKNYFNKKSKWYINDRILRARGNPNWKLKFQMLNKYESALRNKLQNNFDKYLQKHFDKYILNNLRNPIVRYYSEFTVTYFKQINSKKKIYWYLWLLAEAHFTYKSLKVEINPRDGILLRRFVKDLMINPRWIYFSRRFNSRTGRFFNCFTLEIHNIKFIENLKQGAQNLYPLHIKVDNFLIGNKSYRIRFPRFASKEVLMAGLLGFFDGDGTHSGDTARIGNIMAKPFLNDIIDVFDLKQAKIKEHWENGMIRGYYLNLGAEIFNEMLLNFNRSLPRKRRPYTRIIHNFPLTRQQLQKLVSKNPVISGGNLASLIFEQTGINVGKRTVLQKLLEWEIKKVSKEEWQKQTIIQLRHLGWDLRRIWTNNERGLGFSSSSWVKNRWRFFSRIFKNDPLIKNEIGSITERIEKVYFEKKL